MSHVPVQRTALRCEVVSDFHRLQELLPAWQRLWESDAQGEIFQTPEWAVSWWSTFGHNYTLCTLVVFAEDQAIGIVPLVKRDRVIQFLGTPEADYADIICEEDRAEQVLAVALQTLREALPGWSECVWRHISKDSRVMRHYQKLPGEAQGNLRCLPTERYQTILCGENREAVFGALLRKKHTRRIRNKLQKAGEVRFRELPPLEAAGTALNDFFSHHVRRHSAIGKRSVYAAPEARQFVRTLFAKLATVTRFGVLELNGRPLAWYFGFQVNGKFLLYQHTFDLDASAYTPGELLLWHLFDDAKHSVAREFDFGNGNESYKTRFANYSRETFSLFIEPFGWRGRTRTWARGVQVCVLPHLAELTQRAKTHRMTMRTFRAIRTWLLGAFARLRHGKTNASLLDEGLPFAGKQGGALWRKRSADVIVSEAPPPDQQASVVGAHSHHYEPHRSS